MKRLFLLAFALMLASTTDAEIRLRSLFQSQMVLQQQQRVPLTGTAEPNEPITVTCSWLSEPICTKADKEGAWCVEMPTPAATSTPQTIEVVGSTEHIQLTDVLIGEVWLCSGQSNMQMGLRGYPSQPVEGALNELMQASKYRKLRLFRVGNTYSNEKKATCKGSWNRSHAETAGEVSAVGYILGSRLSEALDVPVGIISSAYGGTRIEAWLSPEVIATFDKADLEPKPNKEYQSPSVTYNTMIAPIEGFPLAGVVWLQGESNRHKPEVHAPMLRALMTQWRTAWNQPELPFIICHIAPLPSKSTKFGGACIQEAQTQVTQSDDHAYLVGASDIGDEHMVHYPKKIAVGERVLCSALANVYGVAGLPKSGPVMKSVRFDGKRAIVTFDHADRGLVPTGEAIRCFELAGEDLLFYPAEARVGKNRETVEVTSDAVAEPRYVRYAFSNWHQTNLWNVYGLPAIPFRTDTLSQSELERN